MAKFSRKFQERHLMPLLGIKQGEALMMLSYSVILWWVTDQIISSNQGQGLIGIYSSSSSAVPEPSTMLLMAGALVGLGLYRRTRG